MPDDERRDDGHYWGPVPDRRMGGAPEYGVSPDAGAQLLTRPGSMRSRSQPGEAILHIDQVVVRVMKRMLEKETDTGV